MMLLKNKNLYIVLFVGILVMIVIGTLIYRERSNPNDSINASDKLISGEVSDQISQKQFYTWNVYWDQDSSQSELLTLGEQVTSLSHFAAYFDSETNLFIPDNVTSFYEYILSNEINSDYDHYLTFVNDKMNSDGSSSLKDKALLKELLSKGTNRKQHIEDIVELTQKGQFDGIEVDYEAIKDDLELWDSFVLFIQELYAVAQDKNLKVRVLFEPSAPLEALDLPTGPEYVMMCYNLFGIGTDPGPKANKNFIIKMVQKMKTIQSPTTFALATGGFDWQDDTVVALTEVQAEELRISYDEEAYRDENSQYLVFNYTDESGQEHEVWYADSVTLDFLMNVATQEGAEFFALWRLGGNNHSFDELDKNDE